MNILDIPNKIIETYSNLYFPKSKEHYENTNPPFDLYDFIMSKIYFLVIFYAIYLSFRCNNGFNIIQFLYALFCAPFYILYHLALTKLCGLV